MLRLLSHPSQNSIQFCLKPPNSLSGSHSLSHKHLSLKYGKCQAHENSLKTCWYMQPLPPPQPCKTVHTHTPTHTERQVPPKLSPHVTYSIGLAHRVYMHSHLLKQTGFSPSPVLSYYFPWSLAIPLFEDLYHCPLMGLEMT